MSLTGFNRARREKVIDSGSKAQKVNSEGYEAETKQTQEEENAQNISQKTFTELRQLAKAKEITGYGKMNKKELIEALER